MTDTRLQALTDWCRQQLLDETLQLEVVSGDASFRRYYRANLADGNNLIAVDAPPEKENNHAFVAIDQAFLVHGVHVPKIIHADLKQGFMLLEDLGDCLLLSKLSTSNVDQHYQHAMENLLHLKGCSEISGYHLPVYNRKLLNSEMLLFPQWFLNKHLGHSDIAKVIPDLESIFKQLTESALEQPQVCVHRDYHSRNLMLLDSGVLGVIDFQDAVLGPVTYDLVSLLKDCYISWPRDRVLDWVQWYYSQLSAQQLTGLGSLEQFIRWFDLMGMQRHLKAIGIFARLNYRDNKPDYLADIPRTLDYIREVCLIYPELRNFELAIEENI